MDTTRNPSQQPILFQLSRSWPSWVLAALLALLLFIAPFFPDIKLSRPKLLVLESGFYTLFILFCFAQLLVGTITFKKLFVVTPALLYGGITFLLYALSPDRPIALNELKRCCLSLCSYVVAVQIIVSPRRRSLVLHALLAGSFCAVLYALLQHSGGIGRIDVPKMDRVMSTFGNPIFFAAYLVTVLPVALGLLLESNRFPPKIAYAVFIAAALVALYYAQTRAAFIGFGVSLVVFAWLHVQSRRARNIVLAAIAVSFCVFIFFSKAVWVRQQAHLLIWRDTLAMWLHHPWFGTGPGTFAMYFPQYASDALKKVWPQGSFIVNDAHNEYLQYLSETGIVGFGIFTLLIVSFFVHACRMSVALRPQKAFLLNGCIASVAGLLSQNFFSVDMRFIVSSVYLFFMMGMVNSFADETIEIKNLSVPLRFAGGALIAAAAVGIFSVILVPYRAQRAVARTPDFFDLKVLEPVKTIADLESLARQYPDQSLVFEKLGWVYAKEKKWQPAIASYEQAARLNPGAAGPLNNLGNIYFLLNDRPRAIEYWQRSLALNPRQADSRLNLALAYYYQGRLKACGEQLREVLKIDPANEKAIVLLKQMAE